MSAKIRRAITRVQNVTVTTAGTPVPIIDLAAGTDPLIPYRFTPDFVVYNANDPDASPLNNGYVGGSNVDNTHIPIVPGGNKRVVHGTGSMHGSQMQEEYDLSSFYIDCDENGGEFVVEFASYEIVDVE